MVTVVVRLPMDSLEDREPFNIRQELALWLAEKRYGEILGFAEAKGFDYEVSIRLRSPTHHQSVIEWLSTLPPPIGTIVYRVDSLGEHHDFFMFID